MHHTAKALILHCIDFRFEEAINRFIHQNGYADSVDIVSIAGAAKNIAHPSHDYDIETVLEQIEISKRLHHIKEIILMNHTDCGAYGGSKAFSSKEAEMDQHARDLEAARNIIHKKYPKIKIRKILAVIDANESVTFKDLGSDL